jgi:molybdopterin-guanine dinucleotide biosynthesis protein A
MSDPTAVGVVLAGGRGRRLGGDKAVVELAGRPLLSYALDALAQVCDEVAVTAKRSTLLPPLSPSVSVVVEPDEPQHPLIGVVHALRAAAGRPVLVVPVDLPLIDAATLRRLRDVEAGPALVVAPRVHGLLQPLCARYLPAALDGLERFDVGGRMTAIVEALGVREVVVPDPERFLNVNRPEDLVRAAEALASECRGG